MLIPNKWDEILTCVGQKEISRRPLCDLPKPNSNLSGEDYGIMRICVSFPIRIETLTRHMPYNFLFCL